jgi:chromosomal replication initiation ATPase DnaA
MRHIESRHWSAPRAYVTDVLQYRYGISDDIIMSKIRTCSVARCRAMAVTICTHVFRWSAGDTAQAFGISRSSVYRMIAALENDESANDIANVVRSQHGL